MAHVINVSAGIQNRLSARQNKQGALAAANGALNGADVQVKSSRILVTTASNLLRFCPPMPQTGWQWRSDYQISQKENKADKWMTVAPPSRPLFMGFVLMDGIEGN